jgi:hypothetical protein
MRQHIVIYPDNFYISRKIELYTLKHAKLWYSPNNIKRVILKVGSTIIPSIVTEPSERRSKCSLHCIQSKADYHARNPHPDNF